MKISVVVIAKNEEQNLGRCLKSIKWADEAVVIDDYSSDNTIKIAQKFGARVYKRRLSGNFAAQRNYALTKAQNGWVLFIDADEAVSGALADELQRLNLESCEYNAFKIPRIDEMWGKKLRYGDIKNSSPVRLGRKGAGTWKRAVHEVWDIEGGMGKLENQIIHFPHKNTAEFLEKIRTYALLHSNQLRKEGAKADFCRFIFYPIGKFLVNYLFKLGFLDGTPGFIHAAMMSFHSFIARADLRLKQDKKLKTKKQE